jgi:hypothetical protein
VKAGGVGWAALLAILSSLASSAPAQQPTAPAPPASPKSLSPSAPAPFWDFPAGVRAYWAVGHSRLSSDPHADPSRALVESALRGLVLHTFSGPRDRSPALAPLLTSGVLAGHPYRVCLLDLHAQETHRPDQPPADEIDRLAAVLEIREIDQPERIINVIRAAYARSSPWPRATEEVLRLPEGLNLHTLAGRGHTGASAAKGRGEGSRGGPEPDVSEVSWLATPGILYIGFGPGAIRGFLAAIDGPPDLVSRTYRAAIDAGRPAGEPFFEAFVNLDTLRNDAPRELGWGRCSSLLRAWGLSNARGGLVRGRAAPDGADPRLLILDIAWESRSDPPGTPLAAPISDPMPPRGTPPLSDRADYALVLRTDWPALLGRAVRTYEALAVEPAGAARDRFRWVQNHAPQLARIVDRLEPLTVIEGSNRQTLPVTLRLPIRSVAGLNADLRAVLGSLGPTIRPDGDAWMLRLEPGESDPDALLSGFTFILTPGSIVGSWDEGALRRAARPAPGGHP